MRYTFLLFSEVPADSIFKGIQIRWRQVTPHRRQYVHSRQQGVKSQRRGQSSWESRIAVSLLFYKIGECPEQRLKTHWASWMWHTSFSSCHRETERQREPNRERERERERDRQTQSQLLHLTFRDLVSAIVDVPHRQTPKLHFIYLFNKYRYRIF